MELFIAPGTTEIEDGLYCEREDIDTLVLPDSLERIGAEAFSGCVNLRALICPPSLSEIGPAAFMGCSSLRRAVLSEAQTEISDGCFLECESLNELRFSSKLKSVGSLALQGTALETFNAPISLGFIGEQAFWDCNKLREANVPNHSCIIEQDAFGSCYELTRGYIAAGYCGKDDPVSNLLYTLLILSCPDKHTAADISRAESFVRRNEALIMEWVLEHKNTASMTGIMQRRLIDTENIGKYVAMASERGYTELTALLLKFAGEADIEAEFEL